MGQVSHRITWLLAQENTPPDLSQGGIKTGPEGASGGTLPSPRRGHRCGGPFSSKAPIPAGSPLVSSIEGESLRMKPTPSKAKREAKETHPVDMGAPSSSLT